MKKINVWILTIVLCSIAFQSQAQFHSFAKYKKYISLGYSLDFLPNAQFKTWDSYQTKIDGYSIDKNLLNPIWFTYETGLTNHFGVGFTAGYAHSQYKYENFLNNKKFDYNQHFVILQARGTWHPFSQNLLNIDPYLGISTGYNFGPYTGSDDDAILKNKFSFEQNLLFMYNAFAGVRYFYKTIGAFAEVGYGTTHILQIGLIYRFGDDYQTEKTVW